MNELGRKLNELRVGAGLTQRELARRAPGLTHGSLSRIETGQRDPSHQTLEALAVALRCVFTIDPTGTRCRKL